MTNNIEEREQEISKIEGLDNKKFHFRNIDYVYEQYFGPILNWEEKNRRNSFRVPLISLNTKEIIQPEKIIENLVVNNQNTLDKFIKKKKVVRNIKTYCHEENWNNRLILGDSLLIMNSLLHNEDMPKKVQMIYIDPPYGIKFKYNYDINTSKKTKDKDINKISKSKPEKIKAYRDIWEFGIPSYLSYLRERLLLSKLLLNESGSIFLQINDENLSYIMLIMKEIFGKDNFISIIPFKKTGSATSKYLASVYDYLIWFAKNKKKMKYHQHYRKREINVDLFKTYTKIELENGTRRNLTPEERKTGKFPKNSRLFTTISLASQHYSKERSKPFIYKGKKYSPPENRQWSVSMEEGLKRLAEKNRLYETKNSLRFIYYLDDFPIIPLSNVWNDTMGESSQIYVVQTNTKVVQRCLLMTTDPGDIVFDPTCGSGTTAYLAEKWGRKWITCDTCRIAINLAKFRIMSSIFPYYKINENSDKFDFIYKQYPHISVSTVAYNRKVKYELLYDEPLIDKSIMRVSSPFFLEKFASKSLENPKRQNFIKEIILYLKNVGITYPNGLKLRFKNVEYINNPYIHAKAVITSKEEHKVAFSIGPEFYDVNLEQVEQSIETAQTKKFDWLFILGFGFEESAQLRLLSNNSYNKTLEYQMIMINPEIEIKDLNKETSDEQIFTAISKPEIEILKDDNKFQIILKSLKILNPLTCLFEEIHIDQIKAWLIDEDFNGEQFTTHQVIFPQETSIIKKLISDLKKKTKKNKMKYLIGTKSMPFLKINGKKIAVKIIDLFGNDLIQILQ